ncbi:hypothetical protein DENSPDRAFT_53847 [Dentipellis sp. KUC8613]|nr:hypothetical protein DENSPDRAFT_53847 [Dentipellis sp. KUC8613]
MPKEATKTKTRKAADKAEKAPRGSRKGTKDPKAPKRALSAYMFFSQDWRERIKAENPDASFGEVGKLLGAKWKELDDSEKKPYVEQAARDKARAEQEKAEYDVRGRCLLILQGPAYVSMAVGRQGCSRRRGRRRVDSPSSLLFHSPSAFLFPPVPCIPVSSRSSSRSFLPSVRRCLATPRAMHVMTLYTRPTLYPPSQSVTPHPVSGVHIQPAFTVTHKTNPPAPTPARAFTFVSILFLIKLVS